MAYTNSQAVAGRASKLQYSSNPPSVPYNLVAEIKTIGNSGMKYDLADVTNMESSNFREWLPTLADSGDITFAGNLIANDTSQADLINFFNTATLVSWEIILPPSVAQGFETSLGTFAFKAYVSSVDRSIPIDKEMSITFKLKVTGEILYSEGS